MSDLTYKKEKEMKDTEKLPKQKTIKSHKNDNS